MKRVCCLFIAIGLLMVMLALPAVAAAEELTSDFSTEEVAAEALEEVGMEEIEIEDEDTPLAGLPGMMRSDVARIILGAGCCMMLVAGVILFSGLRHGRAHR